MDEGKIFQQKLDDIAAEMRTLELLYERYFSGEEKREPLQQRAALEKKLRRLSTRRIIKTDHRFRFETLSGRYHTYVTRWNRVQRLMDEGKYHGHVNAGSAKTPPSPRSDKTNDDLYANLLMAHEECNLSAPTPDRNQFNAFVERHKQQIQERFGKRQVEFRVVIENGKPKLRAKAKS